MMNSTTGTNARRSQGLGIAGLITSLCAGSVSGQAPQYSLIALGSVEEQTVPWRMNNKGEVLGYSRNGPFLYRNDGMRQLGSIVAGTLHFSFLAQITDKGVIAGTAQ